MSFSVFIYSIVYCPLQMYLFIYSFTYFDENFYAWLYCSYSLFFYLKK